jgi:hypothetical protein
VYTRIAPRGPPSYPPTSSIPRSQPVAQIEQVIQPPIVHNIEPTSDINEFAATQTPDADRTPHASRHTSATEGLTSATLTTPLNTLPDANIQEKESPLSTTVATTNLPGSVIMTSAAKSHSHGQDSPVMNETLSVIDEHITDMNSPHHSMVAERRGTNDSGSEYSSHLDQRLSYINGEETDEEEEDVHTKGEVATWTPDQVAEYLFTAGVESKHCEVFRDQEISGEVLLEMDQTSVFIKEFELGSVGRRLKTWQKIKTLQDEVNSGTRRNTATYSSEVGSEELDRRRSRSNTSTGMLPRIPSLMDRPSSRQTRLSQQQVSRHDSVVTATPMSPKSGPESPRPTMDKRRPSAASVRDMHHSRQSSANEFSTGSLMGAVAAESPGSTPKPQEGSHKKHASFDRGWTMTGASSPGLPSRPLSSSELKVAARSSTDHLSQSTTPTNFDADRGYFSGNDADGRQRNVLRKRTGSTATHSRNSSYTEDQRLRSATSNTRHSRFGSVDSIRDSAPPSAAQKYYGLSINGRRRTTSEASINAPPRPAPPPKDIPSPTVTKLDGSPYEGTVSPASPTALWS